MLCQGVLGGWDDPNPKGWMIFMEKRRKMMEDVDPSSIWDGHGGNPGVPETGIVFVIHNMS